MGVSGQLLAPAALLHPGKGPPVPIVQKAGWAPEPVWTQRLEEKSLSRRAYSSPWWWRQYAPLKRRSTSMWLYGATSQKTLNFILAAVRTWSLTKQGLFATNTRSKYRQLQVFMSQSIGVLFVYVLYIILHNRNTWKVNNGSCSL
jgi:hypothetical protein